MTTPDFISRFGRKFSLAICAMVLGFIVTLVALSVIVHAPASATYIADVVGQFALVLSVSIGAFSGANAAVTWKHGGGASSSETTTQTVVTRASGVVAEPPKED